MSNIILKNAYNNFLHLKHEFIERIDPLDESIQIIGFFDIDNKIWYNAWAIYNETNIKQYKKSVDLLKYIINIEKDLQISNTFEKMIIKYIICSSKIYIYEKKTQLHLILALLTYFIHANSWNVIKKDNVLIYVIHTNSVL